MNILMDTHIIVWALTDDSRLSEKARELLLSEHSTLYYSVVSLWEMSIKHSIHPDIMAYDPKVIKRYCDEAGFFELPLIDSHVFLLDSLKRSNKYKPQNDPFDRVLLAQAKAEKMAFVTHDSLFKGFDEEHLIIV